MGKKKNKSAQNQAQANNPERNGTSTPASVSASDTADQPDISAVDMALDPGEEGAEEQQDEQAVGPAVIEAEGQARDAVQAEAEIGTGVTAEVGEEAEAEEGAEAGPSARRATAEIAALEDVQKAAEQQVAPTTESAAAAASTASHARNGSTSHAHDGRDRAEDRDKAEPAPAAGAGAEGGDDRIRELEDELARVRDEKDALDGQYRSLLGKLTTMRKSLGEKLREDAEELDRRETTITTLSTQVETLESSLSTLQSELSSANAESASLSSQLSAVRSQSDSSSSDVLSLTREMRELRGEMERLRMEREEWEGEAARERERREGMEEEVKKSERREREMRGEMERAKEREREERERADNLQDVLQEFQSSKEMELRSATVDLEKQLQHAATSLSEFKLRCANAETQLSEVSGNADRYARLEKEIKDKERLVAKLRHDAVVNNEHLTEALRRLRKSSSDSNVDRRLVTNILLSFLGAKRGDSKRFEMLNILATILSWDDVEREKAGLQRVGTGSPASGAAAGERPKMGRKGSEVEGRSAEEEAAMNESFSNLFVEFLLKEASQGQPRSKSSTHPSDMSGGGGIGSAVHSPRSPGLVPLPPFSPTGTGTGASTPAFRDRTYSQTSLSGAGMGMSMGAAGSGMMSPTGTATGSADWLPHQHQYQHQHQPPTPTGGPAGLPVTGRKESYNLRTALTGSQHAQGYGYTQGDRTPTPTDR